jgi:hypothetical protein
MNLYEYVGNNSVNYLDPSGKKGFLKSYATATIKTNDGNNYQYLLTSIEDFETLLSDTKRSGSKIVFFEFSGHGFLESSGLRLGEEGILPGDIRSKSNEFIGLDNFEDSIKGAFAKDAVIELEGCYSAYGENSIAHNFKRILPEAKIIGFTGPSVPWVIIQNEAWADFYRGSKKVEIKINNSKSGSLK